jgi:hypothetical protein
MRSTVLEPRTVQLDGDACDVHARLVTDAHGRESLAYCGVYVRPKAPRAGYWYFPNIDPNLYPDALSLLKRLGMISMALGRAVAS